MIIPTLLGLMLNDPMSCSGPQVTFAVGLDIEQQKKHRNKHSHCWCDSLVRHTIRWLHASVTQLGKAIHFQLALSSLGPVHNHSELNAESLRGPWLLQADSLSTATTMPGSHVADHMPPEHLDGQLLCASNFAGHAERLIHWPSSIMSTFR